jgi:hypothetical protein
MLSVDQPCSPLLFGGVHDCFFSSKKAGIGGMKMKLKPKKMRPKKMLSEEEAG